MIRETRPDVVIVTTVDAYHAQYVVRAMELGCDVIVEKPMAIDEHQTQQILDAEQRTGKKIVVTFNARYGNIVEHVKKILLRGDIGKIESVDFHWYLDTIHGASYFRRWHGIKEKSGTLLVHKATHHFDMMNFWLGAEPEEVFAYGKLAFYGKNGPFRSKTCRGCPHTSKCNFYYDITKDQRAMELYVAAESEDQYYRDACLYRPEINIYDSMAVQVRYDNGVHMSYSLNACMPYEGYVVGFNGSKGRLDVRAYSRQPWTVNGAADLRASINFGDTRTEVVERGTGGHGGSDEKLKDHIFGRNLEDPLQQRAGSHGGAMSILIGIAGYRSIESGKPVRIHDLVKFN